MENESPEERGGAKTAENRRVVSMSAKTSGSFRLGDSLRTPRLCVYSPPPARARGGGIAENLRPNFAWFKMRLKLPARERLPT